MQKKFTGIRLLLIFVGINLVMFLMLVTSLTSAHPWLAHVLPGRFDSGSDNSGTWVFFALVLLIDALTVFIAGLALMLPAMLEGAPVDERRLTRHLVDRGGMTEEAKEAIFVALREEAVNAHYQVFAGRAILFAGAVFLAVAFFAVTLSFVRAVPGGEMFVMPKFTITIVGEKSNSVVSDDLSLRNYGVRARDVAAFTADQVAAATALNAPEIYGFHFGALANNPKTPLFTHFIFAFRTLIGFTLVLIIISFLRQPQRPQREKKTIASVEAKLDETKKG